MLSQKLQQKLLQKLSPQQILLMKLLQIPSMSLEQRIKQEIEENPALEEVGEFDDEFNTDNNEDFDNYEDGDSDVEGSEYDDQEPLRSAEDEFDFEDYLPDDEIPEYRLQSNNSSADDDQKESPFVSGVTFHELLAQQLGLRMLNDHEKMIGMHIIGNLDDAGYLSREIPAMVDDLAFIQNISTTAKELERILKIIQQFDPPGVGARTLRECLLIQLKRKPQSEAIDLAILVLDRYFNEFTKKHFDKIIKKTRATEDELKLAIDEILRLNPKPGDSVVETERSNQYIIPDFYVYSSDGELELVLNSRNMPELRLNRSYTEMLETYAETKGTKNSQQKEALMFVKQKVDSARWFIDAIRQRQNTLYVTMRAILDYQYEYFATGDERKLRPMILKDIAEKVGLDISTISRVANSKYVQTSFGTFLLKTFFSESLQNDSGEEVSTREIKKILSDCIDAEDKSSPLTDEELMRILKDKGYNVARRTIAKYREQLNIPVARLRREL